MERRATNKQLSCEIARNIVWYLADEAVGRVGYNQTIFRKIEQDNCFIIQQIDNKARNIFKSFCRHFFTSLFLPTYEATYTAGYLLPTDGRYREHHDHIWIVLQFVE